MGAKLTGYYNNLLLSSLGNNIAKYPEIFQKTLNDGHTIGNHTQNHIKGWKTKAKDYLSNIAEAQKIIDSQNKKHGMPSLYQSCKRGVRKTWI